MRTPFFDEAAIFEDAPEGRVRRAENYLANGWVDFVDVGPAEVVTHIRGESGLYVVHVSEPDASDARCGCKDFLSTGLPCKHVFATVLGRNRMTEAELRAVKARMAALEEALAMGSGEHVTRVMTWARTDPDFLRALEGSEE